MGVWDGWLKGMDWWDGLGAGGWRWRGVGGVGGFVFIHGIDEGVRGLFVWSTPGDDAVRTFVMEWIASVDDRMDAHGDGWVS